MRPTAFLSYSHADQDRVRVLASALEQAGIDVWWDTLIEGGAVFAKSVEVALARCDAVIVAWSKVSVSSDWVLDEASQGREMRKLVPVSLDGTMPPLGFRQYLAVDLRGWHGDPKRNVIRNGLVAGQNRRHQVAIDLLDGFEVAHAACKKANDHVIDPARARGGKQPSGGQNIRRSDRSCCRESQCSQKVSSFHSPWALLRTRHPCSTSGWTFDRGLVGSVRVVRRERRVSRG